jgi:hypothetical protein
VAGLSSNVVDSSTAGYDGRAEADGSDHSRAGIAANIPAAPAYPHAPTEFDENHSLQPPGCDFGYETPGNMA